MKQKICEDRLLPVTDHTHAFHHILDYKTLQLISILMIFPTNGALASAYVELDRVKGSLINPPSPKSQRARTYKIPIFTVCQSYFMDISDTLLLPKLVQALEKLEFDSPLDEMEQDMAIAAYHQLLADQKAGLLPFSTIMLVHKRVALQVTEILQKSDRERESSLSTKRQLFRTNQLTELLNQAVNTPERAEAHTISGRLNDLNRRWRMGTLAFEERSVTLARIRAQLWQLLFETPGDAT